MKKTNIFTLWVISFSIMMLPLHLNAQQESNSPTFISTGTYHGLSKSVQDMPVVTEKEFQEMALESAEKLLNPKIRKRSFPFADDALPKGSDPVWQKDMGTTQNLRDASLIFEGLVCSGWPTDANGSAGYSYYMQAINRVFAIYDKVSGSMIAGPTFFHHLFSGVIGSECNSGDPVVIYDEEANRWVATEMSICGENDYVLVAVSASSDPCGSWHKYSFDVDDVPDYEKIAVWNNTYCMATNNGYGEDIFALERDAMLDGEESPKIVGWDNEHRPFPANEFHYVPPVDNDGVFAPDLPDGDPAPALFITINDDAVGGGADELWIFELSVDWSEAENATFDRVQQIEVPHFDSNFGNTSNAIPQPDQGGLLDALPNFLMHRAQYRNFTLEGGDEVILCCHTVDINNNDQSGIRWYELHKGNGLWEVYQTGTYAPDDGLYRWMGSIAMNGEGEIALGYSVSGTQEYPGIRYCGQTSDFAGTGIMNFEEQVIHTGYDIFGLNRWGDYWNMAVDPADDHTFWFTAQYCDEFLSTKIASFDLSEPGLSANFSAEPKNVWKGNYTQFTDRSTASPTFWEWTFEGGDPGTYIGQDPPLIKYGSSGDYDVALKIVEGTDTNTVTRTDFIEVEDSPYCISRGEAADHWIEAIGVGGHGTYVSGSSGNLGYQDLSGLIYDFEVGIPYDLQITPGYYGQSSAYYFRFWIDLNHDNIFSDPDELVLIANKKRRRFSTSLTVPSDALPGYTKMRISMQKGSAPLPCDIFINGEVEDHTVFITYPAPPPPQPPDADFSADMTVVEVGDQVQFTDQSTNQPDTWLWEFPGGSTEDYTMQHPIVTYSSTGDFDVQLTATNAAGQNTELKPLYISVVEELSTNYCEPVSIDNSSFYIDEVQIGSQVSNTGQGSSGYFYYNDPILNLVSGSIPISLIPNNMKRKFSWRIWMDVNNDAIFDETSERIFALNNVRGIVNEDINIPAYTESTRLRISMKLGGGGALPCEDGFSGEVEDYDVSIGGADLLTQVNNPDKMLLEIYPNPITHDILHINILRSGMPVTIHVYDGNGMLLDSFQSFKEHIQLNTASYPNGILFINVSTTKSQLSRKIIKMK